MVEGILFFIVIYGIFYFIDYAGIDTQTVTDYSEFVYAGLESNYILNYAILVFLVALIYAIYKKSDEIIKTLSYCFSALFIYMFFYHFVYSAYLFALLHYSIENEILFKSAFIIVGIFFLPFLLSSRNSIYKMFSINLVKSKQKDFKEKESLVERQRNFSSNRINHLAQLAREYDISIELAIQAIAADIASDREDVQWGFIIEQIKNNLPVTDLLNEKEKKIFQEIIDKGII